MAHAREALPQTRAPEIEIIDSSLVAFERDLAGLTPFAYLARARIMEAQGQRDAARTLYGRFLDVYDAPVEVHKQLVDEARAALTRMTRP